MSQVEGDNERNLDQQCLVEKTYIGTNAKGALIGIPMKEYIILVLCNDCLSVPSFLKTSVMDSRGNNVGGKETSTVSLPANSSAFRRAERGGIDFKPHSSYGILFSAWFP